MKLSEIKEVYVMVENNMVYSSWSLKQNVNDFLEYIEGDKEIAAEWNRESKIEFPYCLQELFKEYLKYETGEDEDEIEIILPWEMKELEMMKAEYMRNVAL